MHIFNAILYVTMAFTSFLQGYQGFEWNKKSTLTAARQVEFPGIVLEPGIYIVRLRESSERRSLVEILNHDETQVLASVIAVPDHRQRPEGSIEFTFHAVRRGPAPVQTWYFPGDLVGLEFVYTKTRAKEIAKECDTRVMASRGDKDAAIVAITPNGTQIVIDDEPAQTARRKPQ